MSTRVVVLKAVHTLVRHDPRQEFQLHEVLRSVALSHPHLSGRTISSCITRQMCVNAPSPAGRQYADFERIGHGWYRLLDTPLRHV